MNTLCGLISLMSFLSNMTVDAFVYVCNAAAACGSNAVSRVACPFMIWCVCDMCMVHSVSIYGVAITTTGMPFPQGMQGGDVVLKSGIANPPCCRKLSLLCILDQKAGSGSAAGDNSSSGSFSAGLYCFSHHCHNFDPKMCRCPIFHSPYVPDGQHAHCLLRVVTLIQQAWLPLKNLGNCSLLRVLTSQTHISQQPLTIYNSQNSLWLLKWYKNALDVCCGCCH